MVFISIITPTDISALSLSYIFLIVFDIISPQNIRIARIENHLNTIYHQNAEKSSKYGIILHCIKSLALDVHAALCSFMHCIFPLLKNFVIEWKQFKGRTAEMPDRRRTEKLRKIHNDGMPKSCYNERIAKENRPPIGRGI